MIETERRFLLKYLPDQIKSISPVEIEDYMILTGEPHPHLRLRRTDLAYELTKKYPKNRDGSLEMVEETIKLEQLEFDVLKKLPHTGQIKKRYKSTNNGVSIEIDLWQDSLKGLAIVEFEFTDVASAKSFTPPDYCASEVTEDEALAGGKLSGRSYSDLIPVLEKYHYLPL